MCMKRSGEERCKENAKTEWLGFITKERFPFSGKINKMVFLCTRNYNYVV